MFDSLQYDSTRCAPQYELDRSVTMATYWVPDPFILRWYGTLHMDQIVCLNLVKKDQFWCYYARKYKMNWERFTLNGCYGSQPQPFEVGFYRVSANIFCSFTKQDLTVNYAWHVSVYLVLCNKPKFWQSVFLFGAFYRLFFMT